MPTSVYFNNFSNSGEQDLLDRLVMESIRIYGQDMYYIPQVLVNEDKIYGESSIVRYDTAFLIEMYIKSFDGFAGDGTFLSKFGIEIRDQVTLSIARRTFQENLSDKLNGTPRPREGDLVYFPLNKKCFIIRKVDDKPFFYQLGKLQMFDLICDLYEYSGEKFNTGVAEIDALEEDHSLDIYEYALANEAGDLVTDENGKYIYVKEFELEQIEPLADNERLQIESDAIVDFSEKDPWSEGNY